MTTEANQSTMAHTVVTHLLMDGQTNIIEGKEIAFVPETYYERHRNCPHCKSTEVPEYLSDLKELPEKIADLLKCPECKGVYVVLAHPRMYLNKPIMLNWELLKKGGTDNGTQEQEPTQETSASATSDATPSGTTA